jgi:hypothetical protein
MSSFIVEDKGGSFESTPPGMHLARCYRIIDLGTQKSEYMGISKALHKIMLGWEIHGTDEYNVPLKMKDGRPFSVFKNYTFSWSEKANLRIDLQSWRGKAFSQEEMRRFDLKNVLGAWCMLNVIEKLGTDNKMYVNIENVAPVPPMIKNAGFPMGVNPNEMFTLSEPDMTMFQSFRDNLKKKIMASPEWNKLQGKTPTPQAASEAPAFEEDDDIPF